MGIISGFRAAMSVSVESIQRSVRCRPFVSGERRRRVAGDAVGRFSNVRAERWRA